MPFTSYKTIAQVLKEYQIISIQGHFIEAIAIDIPEYFRSDLDFTLRELTFDEGESVACEMLIFPILKEIHKNYYSKLTLWSHKTIIYDENLTGVPDYILAKKSPLGKEVFDQPFLAAVEAKKDDFILGWGQCLAQMVAMQKLNELPENSPVFGIVTNGQFWQFGKLTENHFTKEIESYTIFNLTQLMGALNYVFRQCALVVE